MLEADRRVLEDHFPSGKSLGPLKCRVAVGKRIGTRFGWLSSKESEPFPKKAEKMGAESSRQAGNPLKRCDHWIKRLSGLRLDPDLGMRQPKTSGTPTRRPGGLMGVVWKNDKHIIYVCIYMG